MTQAAIFEAIRDRFETQVGTPQSLRVIHDNAPEPTSVVSSWARFSVSIDDTRQVSTGSAPRYRSTGSATVNLFVPQAKGDGAALALCDAINAAFRGVSLASPDITFMPAPTIVGAAERDEAWCRRTMRIPFRADTVES